ncbi:MAG TPA: two-component regulator propeller domain-containing protein [Cyclobacteriaceae bacterium]
MSKQKRLIKVTLTGVRITSVITFIAILQLSLLCQWAIGQSSLEKIKFDRIGTREGLSHPSVNSIFQDSREFLWIGTTDGLNKYDGYNFTVYRRHIGDTTGLISNNICAVYEDSKQKLWVSTHNGGFYYYDPLKDRLVIVPELSVEGEITTITEDENKTLWITGILNQKAFFANFNRMSNKWEYHYHNLLPPKGVVNCIVQDSEDEYWIAVKQAGLFKWNRKTDALKKINKEGLDCYLKQIIKDNDGNLWLALRNGLVKFNPKTNTFKHFQADPSHPENSIPVNAIHYLCLDGIYLWVSTENGGLCRINIKTEAISLFTFNKDDPHSISDNSLCAIYKDLQNRIWIGTFSKGICVYDKMKDKFQELNIPLSNDVVNAIWIDKKERLWIATEGGLTMRHGTRIQQYTHHQNDKESIPNNPILSIFEDSKNRMWFGSWDGGLSLYNEKHNSFTNFIPDKSNPHSLSNPNVFSVKEESVSHHILASTYNGLNVLVDEQHGKFEKHLDDDQDANNYLQTIYEDHNKTLWLGSIAVLNQYNLKDHTRVKYFFNKKIGSGVSIHCMTEDEDGNLWIGTDKGLHRLKNKKIVETLTIKNGLPTDIIHGILIDHNKDLWLGTTAGISKFNPRTKTFKNYDISDGLISNEFKMNACFKSNDGKLFFGGTGVNVFSPDSIKENTHPPRVFLTGLKIFNKAINIGGADSILHEHISEVKEISLEPEFNFFTIEYVAINFTNSNKNQFAYKLEGFDKDWINAGAQRFATFTNLDPGTYTFHVKASNNDGLWNEEGVTLVVHILPDWYESLWFKVSIPLFAIFIFVCFYFYRTHSISKRNLFLEKVVTERTEKLAVVNSELQILNNTLSDTNKSLDLQRKLALEAVSAREQFLSIMSHEIRTPLNSMIGLTHVLKKREPRSDQKEIIDTLKNSSDHLMNLVNDILDYNKIKANMLELEHSRFNLNEMLHQIHAMFYRMANDKNLDFVVQIGSTMPDKLMGDSTRLIQILSNLISNSIKFTSVGSITLNIHPLKIEGDTVLTEFHISDTGIGIPSDKISLIFKPFQQIKDAHRSFGGTGLGLTIVKNLTELMNGEVNVQSKAGIGTLFKITIPFKIQDQGSNLSSPIPLQGKHLRNTKVLHVEDIESNQFLINNLLSDYEIICDTANNGEEAIAAMQSKNYDIILLDIQMPDMNGFEVANAIRTNSISRNRNTPIIIFSASTDIREDKIKECQANDFIGKPFRPEELIEKMQKVLSQKN